MTIAIEPSMPTADAPLRILGVDPGLSLTGYACVEIRTCSAEPTLVEAGVLRLSRSAPLPTRLRQLHDDLVEIVRDLGPTHLVVESVFTHGARPQTSMLMGHARGVILLVGAAHGMTTNELAPAEVKKAITGHGRASKEQVQAAVATQCGLAEPPSPPDVADAIAIALCAGRRIGSVVG